MITTHYITNSKVLNAINAVYSEYPAKIANTALRIMMHNNEPLLPEEWYERFSKEFANFGYGLMFLNPTKPEHVRVACEFCKKHPEFCEGAKCVFNPVTMIKINPDY